jgi:hypothetical protein
MDIGYKTHVSSLQVLRRELPHEQISLELQSIHPSEFQDKYHAELNVCKGAGRMISQSFRLQ